MVTDSYLESISERTFQASVHHLKVIAGVGVSATR